LSSSTTSTTSASGGLPPPYKFGDTHLRGSAVVQSQQQILQQQQQQPSAMQVLAFIFKSIVNYKKLTQEPEPDILQSYVGGGGGGGEGKISRDGPFITPVVPGGVALRHNVGAGGLGAGVAAKYKEVEAQR
jgi:hypothetical protein